MAPGAPAMRVVAGKVGGRRLVAPAGSAVRPTSDRVREAVFSSLEAMGAVQGARVLDLFAGTGALAIEALSRGASSAVLVEPDRTARGAVAQNLSSTGLEAEAQVVASEALAFLGRTTDRYDLVLADPPYRFEGWSELLVRVGERCEPGAFVLIESAGEVPVPGSWHVERDKRYGGTFIRIATVHADPTTPAGPEEAPG